MIEELLTIENCSRALVARILNLWITLLPYRKIRQTDKECVSYAKVVRNQSGQRRNVPCLAGLRPVPEFVSNFTCIFSSLACHQLGRVHTKVNVGKRGNPCERDVDDAALLSSEDVVRRVPFCVFSSRP